MCVKETRKFLNIHKKQRIIVGGSITSKMSKKNLREKKSTKSNADNRQNTDRKSQSPQRVVEDNVIVRVRNAKRKTAQSEKKSTGCGPSPPKEIEPSKIITSNNETVETYTDSVETNKKQTTSTGTSPLPQSISTQVGSFDELNKKLFLKKYFHKIFIIFYIYLVNTV